MTVFIRPRRSIANRFPAPKKPAGKRATHIDILYGSSELAPNWDEPRLRKPIEDAAEKLAAAVDADFEDSKE